MKLSDNTMCRLLQFAGLLFFVTFQGAVCQEKEDGRSISEFNEWFTITTVADRVWCIDDHGHDNIYLVEGDEKALLIDTGYGIADLATCVRSITEKPLMVVNTHGHPDHAGGNFQFSEIYIHPSDFETIHQFTGKEFHDDTFKRMKDENPGLISAMLEDDVVYEMPSLVPVREGYLFDLGNRQLEVIEVPGHTPGSIVLLDSKNKLLFTGDNNNIIVWLFVEGSLPVEAYLQMLLKLNQRGHEFDLLLPGHGHILDKAFINEQIICAQNIISGACPGEKYETFAGPALLCEYKRAGIAFNSENIHITQ